MPAQPDASPISASRCAASTDHVGRRDRVRSAGHFAAPLALACLGCRPEPSPPASISATVDGVRSAAILAEPPRFLARLEFPTAGPGRAKPVRVLAGDLDGDGRDELVATTRSPGGIEIWSGISPVIAPAPEPRAFAYGDFPLGPVWIDAGEAKGAGSRSLAAIASRETLELAVVDLAAALRSKAGEGLPVRSRAQLPARPRAIASGDLGRDGRADVAVVTIDEELLVYATSDLPAAPRRIPLPREHAVALLVASDGERIAVGFQGSRKIAILRSDGTVESSTSLPGIPRELLEADLDGDGDTELAVAAGDDSLVVFGLGRPGGPASWLASSYAVTPVGTVPIALAAMRGSGRSNAIAVLDLHAQDVRLLDFAKGSAAPLDLRAAGQRPTDLAVGDFDGDGALDLAIANGDSRRVGLLFGAGGKPSAGMRFDSETRVPCDRSPASIAAGDVDGDGRADVAVLAAADETLAVLTNEQGALARRSAAIPAPGASSVACADLDGDGHAEVACLQHGAGGSAIACVRSGTLETVATIPGRSEPADLVLARISKSSPAFALVALPEANEVGLATVSRDRSGGGIRFGEMRTFAAGSGPRALALLRGKDGELRVAVADGGGGPSETSGLTLLDATVDEAGGVRLEHPIALAMKQRPFALAAADLDGDGREDLAVLATESGGDSQGFVVPWIAGADGGWRALDPMPTGGRPFRIAACDVDGDGRSEILVTAQGSHHVEVWLARGSPVRFVRTPDLGAGTGPLDLTAVDLDGDGRNEIVVANGFSDDVSVIRVR